jgi:hypothetical protein
MSVFMLLQGEGDVKRLAEIMENRDRWEAINERAQQNGAILRERRRQKFFESSPEIPQMMVEAGVTAESRVQIWHPVDTPDAF